MVLICAAYEPMYWPNLYPTQMPNSAPINPPRNDCIESAPAPQRVGIQPPAIDPMVRKM